MLDWVPDPGLPDVERELGVEVARDRLVGHPADQVGLPLLEPAGAGVHRRGSLLDVAVGVVNRLGHAVVADVEVGQRALRLGAPVVLGGYLDVAEGVGLGAGAGGVESDREIEDRWGVLFGCHGLAFRIGR
jgi:hypothetical protein